MNEDKKRSRRVVKANDALTKAKEQNRKHGTAIPESLREELREAVADYEKHNK